VPWRASVVWSSLGSWCPCALSSLFFFFSSRRRHTRFSRDWSSDVCSSDLGHVFLRGWRAGRFPSGAPGRARHGRGGPGHGRNDRSEERRVGKSGDLGGRRSMRKKQGKEEHRDQSEKAEYTRQQQSSDKQYE